MILKKANRQKFTTKKNENVGRCLSEVLAWNIGLAVDIRNGIAELNIKSSEPEEIRKLIFIEIIDIKELNRLALKQKKNGFTYLKVNKVNLLKKICNFHIFFLSICFR